MSFIADVRLNLGGGKALLDRSCNEIDSEKNGA